MVLWYMGHGDLKTIFAHFGTTSQTNFHLKNMSYQMFLYAQQYFQKHPVTSHIVPDWDSQ